MPLLHCKMDTKGYWWRLYNAYEVERWQPHIEKLPRGEVKPPLHVQFTLKEVQQDIDEVLTVLVVNPCQPNCPWTGRENSTAPVWWIFFGLPFVALLDINNLTHHTLPVFKSIGKTIRDNKMAYHELKSLTRVVTYFSCFLWALMYHVVKSNILFCVSLFFCELWKVL